MPQNNLDKFEKTEKINQEKDTLLKNSNALRLRRRPEDMDMTALQRSTTSFRRQGSSGLIWDDKILSGELKKVDVPAGGGGGTDSVMRRSRSDGGKHMMYRTPVKAEFVGSDGGADPPSPKVQACGLCAVFGNPKKETPAAGKGSKKKQKNRPTTRKS